MSPLRGAVTAVSLVVLSTAAFATPARSAAAAERVDLPTEEDILAVAYGAETLLYGAKGIETLLPGPVEDDELVTVEIGPTACPPR
jgi:hypothetical protein